MKKVYWRPQSIPVVAFVMIAIFSMAGLAVVEHFKLLVRKPHYREKIEASRLAFEAMELAKNERLRRGIPIDPETDPAYSGMIGSFVTPVTTDSGELEAKRTSINPNMAAVIVHLLKQEKLKEGDVVAVGYSGSFPAINIAVCAAITTLKLRPIIISSVGASQWGANDPGFLWIDMESFLHSQGIFPFQSAAASMGGKSDRGKELTDAGRNFIREAIKRNGLTFVEARGVRRDIDERMRIYFNKASPKIYINVGGGVASAGIRPTKRLLKSGILRNALPTGRGTDSVIHRFMDEGIPVIHIDNIKNFVKPYGFPVDPSAIPKVGEGTIFHEKQYNLWLAGIILLGIIFGLYMFARVDWGFRLLKASSKEEAGPPEPML
jgi:poly-gamma-glutamate system protein